MSKKILLDLITLEKDFLLEEHNSQTLAVKYNCSPNTILRNLRKISNPLVDKKLRELKRHQYNKIDHVCEICNSNDNVTYTSKINKYLCHKHRSQIDRVGEILEITKYDSNIIIEHTEYAEIYINDIYSKLIGIALIDIEDIDKVKKYKWHLNSDGYVVSLDENNKFISLHYLVLGIEHYKEKKMKIDHIDRNPLNNRKYNLRKATNQQNGMNRNLHKNNTSGIMGVCWDNTNKDWIAQLKYNNKNIRAGHFDIKENAIIARLKLELKYFGVEFAPQRHLFELYDITKYIRRIKKQRN
jgi:hypothetical protein